MGTTWKSQELYNIRFRFWTWRRNKNVLVLKCDTLRKWTIKIENELNLYLSIPKFNFEQDSLEWWNLNKDYFPTISISVTKTMTVQTTSIASERVFSKGDSVLTDFRSSLTNEHATQLIFLSMNKNIIIARTLFLNWHFNHFNYNDLVMLFNKFKISFITYTNLFNKLKRPIFYNIN